MALRIRVGSIVTLGLVAAYHVLRILAGQCTGPVCEGYIAPSLFLPLLILVVAAATGLFAAAAARRAAVDARDPATARRYAIWLALLVSCTALGVLGPVAGAVVWRDHPDTLVPVATALALLIPVGALLYSLLADRSRAGSRV